MRYLTLRGQRANLGAGRAHRAHAIRLERGELRAQLRDLRVQLGQLLLRGRQLVILEAPSVVLGALSGALQRGQRGRVRGGGGAVVVGLLNEGGSVCVRACVWQVASPAVAQEEVDEQVLRAVKISVIRSTRMLFAFVACAAGNE
jgi:hypothetical protein